jgi:nucleoside-diphosphate-sugar epimerase
LADLIKQEMQFKGDIFFTNEQREGDPLHWRADTSAINALGFSASSGFDKYLTEIVAWATR